MEVLDNKRSEIFIKDIYVTWSQIFDRRGTQWVCWRDPRERDHLEHIGVDGTIILKWIFKKWDGDKY